MFTPVLIYYCQLFQIIIMKRNIFFIVVLLAIMFSCKKQEPVVQQSAETVDAKAKNPEFYGAAAKAAIDSFFNALPDKIDMDYVNGRITYTMADGTTKIKRIPSTQGKGPSKKASYQTIIDISEPDPGLPGNHVPGAIIRLEGQYFAEVNQYYQSEYVTNPIDMYGSLKVIRSIFNVTRSVNWSSSIGLWSGYANYVIYEYNVIQRTKQVQWSGSLYIPRF